MRIVIALIVIVFTLGFFASASHAHYGDRWFATKANVQSNVKDKWMIDYAGCFGDKAFGHTFTRGFKTAWDHWACLIDSEVSARTCWVLAHVTGEEWYQTVLTGYRAVYSRYPSCSPSDIRRRAGGF